MTLDYKMNSASSSRGHVSFLMFSLFMFHLGVDCSWKVLWTLSTWTFLAGLYAILHREYNHSSLTLKSPLGRRGSCSPLRIPIYLRSRSLFNPEWIWNNKLQRIKLQFHAYSLQFFDMVVACFYKNATWAIFCLLLQMTRTTS